MCSRTQHAATVILTLAGFILLTAAAVVGAADAPAKSYRFQAETIPSGVVKPGEKVVFKVKLLENGKPVAGLPIETRLLVEGEAEKIVKTVSEADFITVEAARSTPGFIYFKADYIDSQTKRGLPNWWVGVAVEPEKIAQALAEPADFDTFWEKAKAKLNAVPLRVERKKIEPADAAAAEFKDRVDGFEIRLDCADDTQVLGYLTLPKNAGNGQLPAMVNFAGGGIWTLAPDWKTAAGGFLTFTINAHGVEKGGTEEAYLEKLRKLLYYTARDWPDPEKVYFHGMLLRALRAVEYVKTLPEWNRTALVVAGASQGGAQALAIAGLDSDVTFCYAGIPGLCNLAGPLKRQSKGWPLNFNLADPAVVKTTGYYDNCNFARRIKAETLVTVGYYDTMCPPSNVYAAYNNIAAKKTLWPGFTMHHAPGTHQAAAMGMIRTHAGLPVLSP